MHIIYKLVSPLAYLLIHHPQKRVVDILLPLIFSVLITYLVMENKDYVQILTKDGLVDSLSKFVQFLTGFYVAALAAIATFPNKNMDQPIDGKPLKLGSRSLTRRQFLSNMFGFLAFVGLFTVFTSEFFLTFNMAVYHWENLLGENTYLLLKSLLIFLYSFLITSLLFTTLYGLYYLTSKIHETRPEFTSTPVKKETAEDDEF